MARGPKCRLGANSYPVEQATSNAGATRAARNPITTVEKPAIIRPLVGELTTWKAHSGPSSAKARVESQLAAWAIVGCEHITVRDQPKMTTHATPTAIRTNP
jgi:hypothetical protein